MWLILVCDEVAADLFQLREMIRGDIRYQEYQIRCFKKIDHLISYLQEEVPEQVIVILPFHPSEVSGINGSIRVRELIPSAQIVFVTERCHFSSLVYEVEHAYLLLKPIQRENLWRGIVRAMQKAGGDQGLFIPVCTKQEKIKVRVREIFYIEKELRRIHIHTKSSTVTFYGKFNDISSYLPASFCRCHNSYIVNMNYVTGMKEGFFYVNGMTLPISQRKHHDVRLKFQEFLLKKQ